VTPHRNRLGTATPPLWHPAPVNVGDGVRGRHSAELRDVAWWADQGGNFPLGPCPGKYMDRSGRKSLSGRLFRCLQLVFSTPTVWPNTTNAQECRPFGVEKPDIDPLDILACHDPPRRTGERSPVPRAEPDGRHVRQPAETPYPDYTSGGLINFPDRPGAGIPASPSVRSALPVAAQ